LAFRPNPQNLVDPDQAAGSDNDREEDLENDYDPTQNDEIYRPPRIAPMPYPTTSSKSKNQLRRERPPIPSALASLSFDLSRPHIETTSGLGGTPSLNSGRAAYLKRLNDFEEENFTRLVMKKKDARQRLRDEADLALGGTLGAGPSRGKVRKAGGFEDEFGDVLRSVDRGDYRGGRKVQGDGYEELRRRGKKASVLERSRAEGRRKRDTFEDGEGGENGGSQPRKKSRFELAAKAAKRRLRK
jgi:U3 small nucleolar ribonucleoprotein protein LCP5